MKSGKFSLILLFTLIIGGAAMYFSQEEVKERKNSDANRVFLSGLSNRVNDVARIEIKQDSKALTLVKNESEWEVKEKNFYPADFSKIKSLLLNLRELKTIEPKTSRPDSYGRLGVQNPGEAGEVATKQLVLYDRAGNKLESVNIGKQKQSKMPGGKPAHYVRKTTDAESWLVQGNLSVAVSESDWLAKQIIDIKSSEIKTVRISHPDKSHLQVSRENADEKDFTLSNLPVKATVKTSAVNALANSLQSLSFNDVLPRDGFKLGGIKPVVAEFTTFSGLVIKVKLAEKESKHYLMIDTLAKTDDQIEKSRAIELGSHLAKWVFEVAEFKTSNMKKTLKDLIESDK